MQPQPIETAPKDGTVILTDSGVALWNGSRWPRASWIACDPQGASYECEDYGSFALEPTLWTPLPDWMKG